MNEQIIKYRLSNNGSLYLYKNKDSFNHYSYTIKMFSNYGQYQASIFKEGLYLPFWEILYSSMNKEEVIEAAIKKTKELLKEGYTLL